MTKVEIETAKKNALGLIELKLDEVRKLINEAEDLADENGVSFYYNPGYYGNYGPVTSKYKLGAATDLLEVKNQEEGDGEDNEWHSSEEGWESSNC